MASGCTAIAYETVTGPGNTLPLVATTGATAGRMAGRLGARVAILGVGVVGPVAAGLCGA